MLQNCFFKLRSLLLQSLNSSLINKSQGLSHPLDFKEPLLSPHSFSCIRFWEKGPRVETKLRNLNISEQFCFSLSNLSKLLHLHYFFPLWKHKITPLVGTLFISPTTYYLQELKILIFPWIVTWTLSYKKIQRFMQKIKEFDWLRQSCDIFKQYDWLKFSIAQLGYSKFFIRSCPGLLP